MKRRVMAILCCAALLSTVLFGCGAEPVSSASEPAPEASIAETPSTPSEAPAPAPEEPNIQETSAVEAMPEGIPGNPFDIVLPGMDTAELSFSNVYSLPLSEDGATITVMHEALNLMGPLANLGIDNFQAMDYIQEIQARTGITLEITEMNFFTKSEQQQLAIASGTLPDLVYGLSYSTGDEGALADEVIVDLTDYAEYAPNYFYMISSNPAQEKQFLSDGKVLKFMAPYEQYRANQGLVIRKDWLEEQGLEVPETYDQMTEVLKAFIVIYIKH